MLSMYAMHNSPHNWEKPSVWDPERFVHWLWC